MQFDGITDTIAPWSPARLRQFIATVLSTAMPHSITVEQLTVSQKLTVRGGIELSPQAVAYIKTKLGL